ncbi:hypothetical protein [Acidaminococcus massiliensis]|uniref:hypothetical protein n=1 Tax=Acidaminococcus massiliensis TaxID=1852375 RepID=UPI00094EE452|nr:hypothetical protein [Acidaminococcus massiliensis]
MKRQTFQAPEIRDENNNIISAGTYGKETALVNATNDGVLDYINNNLLYLHDNITGGDGSTVNADTITGKTATITDITATTVNADTITGALTGNLTGNVTGNVTGDLAGTAAKATADGAGNKIIDTYVTKTALAQSVTTASLSVSGTATAPTANADNNSATIATTAFVKTAVANLVDSAPDALNTLKELATALGNDANFSTTVTNEIAAKVAKAGDTITGPILYEKTPSDGTELVNKNYVDNSISTAHSYIKRSTAYSVGDVLESPNLPPGCVIVVTTAGTTGTAEPDWSSIKSSLGGVITDGTVTFYINDTLSKHSVGDIVYKPLTKTGEHEYLLPLDGQTIDGTTYKRLVDYLGTTTLPDLNGRYLRADTTPGTMVAAGLPNITGKFDGGFLIDRGEKTFTGAFQYGGTNNAGNNEYGDPDSVDIRTDSFGGKLAEIKINASASNAIYGNSDTVTPLTYTVRAYIAYA